VRGKKINKVSQHRPDRERFAGERDRVRRCGEEGNAAKET
jgi:hypothetical protein